MIYLKSVLCGLAAVILSAIAAGFGIITLLAIKSRNLPPGQSYGWDPVSLLRNSTIAWLVLAVAFVAGFAWEYRHAANR